MGMTCLLVIYSSLIIYKLYVPSVVIVELSESQQCYSPELSLKTISDVVRQTTNMNVSMCFPMFPNIMYLQLVALLTKNSSV